MKMNVNVTVIADSLVIVYERRGQLIVKSFTVNADSLASLQAS